MHKMYHVAFNLAILMYLKCAERLYLVHRRKHKTMWSKVKVHKYNKRLFTNYIPTEEARRTSDDKWKCGTYVALHSGERLKDANFDELTLTLERVRDFYWKKKRTKKRYEEASSRCTNHSLVRYGAQLEQKPLHKCLPWRGLNSWPFDFLITGIKLTIPGLHSAPIIITWPIM